MEDNLCIHHWHVTGEIIGYAHFFCNEKTRGIIGKYQWLHIICSGLISFFLLKGLWSGVWRTRDTIIGGKNPTDISFASIRNQIQFLHTIKYFQQSLGGLASSLTDNEKGAIYMECLIQFSLKGFYFAQKMKRNGYLISNLKCRH